MASKRPCPQDEGESNQSLAKRSRPWNLCYGEVTSFGFAQGLILQLEPMLRGVLQEEIPKAILNYVNPIPRPSINQIHGAIRFRLHFLHRLPRTLFTNRGIISEDKTPIRLAIVDTNSNENVTSEPWASLKVKIVALRGDFNHDGAIWSREEFESHVQSERDGHRPLLTGELNVRMSNGVAVIHDARFTDNSRWTRSGMFRLGAVISDGRYNGERVQEAISEAVKVKDVRVEMSQKDSPPSLTDKVFCLKKIQKGGPFHQKLETGGVNTVQDFLRSYVMDHNKLRTLLGTGMSNKWWETTVNHAFQCNLGNKLYLYRVADKGIVLVFNSIFQLHEIKVNGSDQHEINLPSSLKGRLDYYVKLAYENEGDIHELHDTPGESVDSVLVSGPSLCNANLHNSDNPTTFHDVSTSQMDFQNQVDNPYNALSCNISQPGFFQLHQHNTLQKPGSFRNSSDRCTSLLFPGLSSSQVPINGTAHHAEEAQHVGSQLVSTSRRDVILIQRSDSFSMKKMSMNPNDDQQNQRLQCTDFLDGMSGEEWEDWMAQMIQSPSGETLPLSPRKWVQLIAVFKFISALKRSTCRRVTARFKTSKFSLEGMDQFIY